ncbi:MAG: hypothetical protein LQ352_002249 [Teloschistes flavicans]|nr:MAG: hypothetical protein LQ352_002249 [Teloschistes flavicans]
MSEAPGGTPSTAGRSTAPSTSLQHDDEVPDPDEDDLDDLDELLDAFSSSNHDAQQPAEPAIKSLQHGTLANNEPPRPANDDFSQQLQAQMAALIGNGDESPEMQKEIEAVLHELKTTIDPPSAPQPPKGDASLDVISTTTEESFQEAILQTMQRMQNSGEKANAAAASDEASNDILSNMMKEMQNVDTNGSGSEEEFSNMLMTMMENLTNKDILYDPMKELNDKFPSWMSANRGAVKTEDMLRYEKQQRLVAEIVKKFEESTYSDANTADRQYILERMHKMQAAGSPPADLVGDMSGAQEALQDMDTGCTQQ